MFSPFLPPNRRERRERTGQEGLDEEDDICHITKPDRTRFTGMVSPPSRVQDDHLSLPPSFFSLPLPPPFLSLSLLLLLIRGPPQTQSTGAGSILGCQEDIRNRTRRSSKV